MTSKTEPPTLYYNKDAVAWNLCGDRLEEIERDVSNFHETLGGYEPTPLTELPNSHEFGVKKVFIKEESSRFGLPSFKILGASWAIHKVLVSEFSLPSNTTFSTIQQHIRTENLKNTICLVCATDGNHGRAVARVAYLLGIKSEVYVPSNVLPSERAKIKSEGNTNLTEIRGDYDEAVETAYKFSLESKNRYFIQDTSFTNYTNIPQSIVEGYNTLLNEVDSEVLKQTGTKPGLVICGTGVGSFAQAVVTHYRAGFRKNSKTKVMIVEPSLSRCCNKSLTLGEPSRCDEIQTTPTIMDGLNCPTISELAFPILKLGLTYSLIIDDDECHSAVEELDGFGIATGPCGAAPYATLKKYFRELISAGDLNETDSVVLISTEYKRIYNVPSSSRL